MKKYFIIFILLVLTSCSKKVINSSSIIRIKGSDTMLYLNKKLAEEYMIRNSGISVYVEGGGTKTGILALMNSEVEICAASRPLEPIEIKEMGEKFNTVGMSTMIGRDALSIYINPNNPVENLSLEQVRKIFTCEINNWKEVGGRDESIFSVTRSSSSGTYLYFIKHILMGEAICNTSLTLNTTKSIIDIVASKINSIGYGGIGYGNATMQCNINGVEPTRKNVLNNTYPISRYLRYYTPNKPKGNIKKYIDWVISIEGQQIVDSMGYISLWE